jgi:hypothetical protein
MLGDRPRDSRPPDFDVAFPLATVGDYSLVFLVELPAIEPAIEITLTCRNAKLQSAKRRESA